MESMEILRVHHCILHTTPYIYNLILLTGQAHQASTWILRETYWNRWFFIRFLPALRFERFHFTEFYHQKSFAKRSGVSPSAYRSLFDRKTHMIRNGKFLKFTIPHLGPNRFRSVFLCAGCGDRVWYLRHSRLIRDFLLEVAHAELRMGSLKCIISNTYYTIQTLYIIHNA